MPSNAAKAARLPSCRPPSAAISARPNDPPETEAPPPGARNPSFIWIVSAPPSVLSPNTGFDPGRSCIDATAFLGRRSQFTTSAKASLIRTPSWNTDRPCGVPRSADAVNPRKLTSGWYALPVGEPSEVLFALKLRNSATPPVRCRSSSPVPKDWTFDGTCSTGVPSPGRGAVPTTSTGPRGTTGGDCPAAIAPAVAAATASAARSKRRSADRDTPGQLADRDLGDLRVRVGVDDRDRVGTAARDVELLPVRGERHVPRPLADGDRRDDRVRRSVDHLDRAFAARAHEDPLAVRVDDDAIRALANLDACDHLMRPNVDHVHDVRVLRRDVRAAAVREEADAARA